MADMTEILVAPVACALKLKEELEKEKALRREAEENLEGKADTAAVEAAAPTPVVDDVDSELEEEMKGQVERIHQKISRITRLSCSSINHLSKKYDSDHLPIPGRAINELKLIINNPTLTILQEEEGARPSQSYLGKGDVKKCKVYPHIKSYHGTGYLRWVVGDTTYYLCGSDGRIKNVKTCEIEALKGKGHHNTKVMWGVGEALYYGLEDLIKST